MTTRRSAINEAIEELERADVAHARRNAEWMLCEVLRCSRALLYANLDETISEEELHDLRKLIERRRRHEPLQYVLGYTEFFGLRIAVTPDVLIPRPETEQVVEQALEAVADTSSPRVLDVGTGSGCIALAIKSRRPDAHVYACDVSNPALHLAKQNAAANQLVVEFLQLDVMSDMFPMDAPDRLDLLVSNPPYVAEDEFSDLPVEVREYEPALALIAHEDPLSFYRKIARDARRLLRSGGRLVFETHEIFGPASADAVRSLGYEDVHLKHDYADRPRILLARRPAG